MKYDIVVIGGGAGGLVVAVGAATLGAKVALIEKNKLGGDCLYHGCVPSKTLIHSAKVVSLMRRAKEYGLGEVHPKVDFAKVTKHVQDVIKSIEVDDSAERFEKLGVEVIFGSPKFSSNKKLEINGKVLESKKFVIATGSRPAEIPIEGLKETGYITNLDIFKMKKRPKSLIVIGGGPIGSEMAQAFARFGTKVCIVERANHILSREDDDVAEVIQKLMEKEGVVFFNNSTTKKVIKNGSKKVVILEKDGKDFKITADEILMAV